MTQEGDTDFGSLDESSYRRRRTDLEVTHQDLDSLRRDNSRILRIFEDRLRLVEGKAISADNLREKVSDMETDIGKLQENVISLDKQLSKWVNFIFGAIGVISVLWIIFTFLAPLVLHK